MSGQDYEQLSLFPGDSPVSRSVWPGSAEAKRMTVTSGQKCLELSKNSGPLGSLEKTLLESSIWRSTKCFLTWKAKVTKQGRLLFRLVPSTPRTDETAVPLLPTPTATTADHGGPNQRDSSGRPGLQMAAMMWPTPRANKVGGYSSPGWRPTLEEAVRLWPTPTVHGNHNRPGSSAKAGVGLATAVKMFPTPTARDSKGANSMKHLTREGKRNHTSQLANCVKLWPTPTSRCGTGASQVETRQGGPDLQTAVQMFPTPQARDHFPPHSAEYIAKKKAEGHGMSNLNDSIGGQLNPTWVEWLMGFPLGWTDLSASETP